MVGLHVVHYQVVGLFAVEYLGYVVEPFVGFASVHGVENGGFFVGDYIRVVRHSFGYVVLAFKQVDV